MLSMTLNRPLSFWNMMYEEQFDKVVESNGDVQKQQVRRQEYEREENMMCEEQFDKVTRNEGETEKGEG